MKPLLEINHLIAAFFEVKNIADFFNSVFLIGLRVFKHLFDWVIAVCVLNLSKTVFYKLTRDVEIALYSKIIADIRWEDEWSGRQYEKRSA